MYAIVEMEYIILYSKCDKDRQNEINLFYFCVVMIANPGYSVKTTKIKFINYYHPPSFAHVQIKISP